MENGKYLGIDKPDIQSLSLIGDRLTFLYVEHCKINRQDGAIRVADYRGVVCVPASILSVLFLGPGTELSHRAVELIADSGTTLVWVGEQGVRYYASGRPLTHSSALLLRQAEVVTNVRKRINAARTMYQMRFGGEDVSTLTMQQLRGKEGARVRRIYRQMAAETGVKWDGREYDPDHYEKGTAVNQALSCANACLYGLAHSVISALGMSSGLGVVHTGHERSLVYDIADLYKAETSIPVAFRIAAERPQNLESAVRHAMRDVFFEAHILKRMVSDIKTIFEIPENEISEISVLQLWDNREENVEAGIFYFGVDELSDSDVNDINDVNLEDN